MVPVGMSNLGCGGAVVQYAGVPVMVDETDNVDVVAAVLAGALELGAGEAVFVGVGVAVGWARAIAGRRAKTTASERRLMGLVVECIL